MFGVEVSATCVAQPSPPHASWPGRRAKDCLDRAVALRGDNIQEGYYYQYNRERCAVELDSASVAHPRQPADPAMRETVIEVLKQSRRQASAGMVH